MAVDVHQLLYGRTTLHKWTSISFSKDVQHNICVRPPVSAAGQAGLSLNRLEILKTGFRVTHMELEEASDKESHFWPY